MNTLANEESLKKTVASLAENGIASIVVNNKSEAKGKILELIPEGAEVMTMTSVTLDSLDVLPELNESGKYNSVRAKLNTMDRETQGVEMHKLGAAPEYTIGSVHAVTEDGKVVVASNTGSQLAAYVYGAAHVIWVVGTQKIVPDLNHAEKRVYEDVLPLESERVQHAYGMTESFVSKLLIINREVKEGRITIIFVKESLGF